MLHFKVQSHNTESEYKIIHKYNLYRLKVDRIEEVKTLELDQKINQW